MTLKPISTEKLKRLYDEYGSLETAVEKQRQKLNELKSRVKDLEELEITADGKTLQETEEAVVKAKEKEISTQTQELFNNMKKEWERIEKPKEVSAFAVEQLKTIIKDPLKIMVPIQVKMQDGKTVRYYPVGPSSLDQDLQDKVEMILSTEVAKRLDAEFNKRVESQSEKIASDKLKVLVSQKWPEWYESNIAPKISKMAVDFANNALNALRGLNTILCDKCLTPQNIDITYQKMDALLRTGVVYEKCINDATTRGTGSTQPTSDIDEDFSHRWSRIHRKQLHQTHVKKT